MYHHLPVMLDEVLTGLKLKEGDYLIDGTLGGAGYTRASAKIVGPQGRVLAIDLDDLALKNARRLLKEADLKNVVLVKDNFRNMQAVVSAKFPAGTKFQGIVLDLGLSSAQLADEQRGFSFQGKRPLDMAFGAAEKSTLDIVNNYRLETLAKIFREYGEERFAYQIAKKIVAVRKEKYLENTEDLVAAILSALPARFRASRLNPATKVFQALRIETNQELEALKAVLPQTLDLLAPGGRLAIVSFHSGEDRIVKNFLRDHHLKELRVITKKPLVPQEKEITANSRARSAKLRIAEKIDPANKNDNF